MEGMTRVCQDILKYQQALGHPVPLLYSSGVVYQREDGTEDWQDIYTTLEKKWGDCEDLAFWRTAELRVVFRRPASPFLTFRRDPDTGSFHFHALLIAKGPGGWRLEDPSRKLGMGFENMFEGMGRKERDLLIAKLDGVQKKLSAGKLTRMVEVG
jgi:hypothetical protein